MRYTDTREKIRVRAIAGTRTILMALDCDRPELDGLLGFGFRREIVGQGKENWLFSQKVFRSVVPDPKNATDPQDPSKKRRFRTDEFPIQSFLWSDYSVEPDTEYRFSVVPMYGSPGRLEPGTGVSFSIRTEKEFDQGHGIWFNRGAIASQAFARERGNHAPAEPDNPDHADTRWLSRGLLEACLAYIDGTPAGDGLRVAAYEFTYRPVLDSLKKALDRGVDVRFVVNDTVNEKGKPGANEKAIAAAGIPEKAKGKQILFWRTKTKIPHNKFIIRLKSGTDPAFVWTGSTNITPSGFLGQTNVGHLIGDPGTAAKYLEFWESLRADPERDEIRSSVMDMTPQPGAVIPEHSVVPVFSPRPKTEMLKWYGARISDATGTVMITNPFGVSPDLVGPLAENRDYLRFVLMEKPPTDKIKAQLTRDHDLQYAYGSILGEMYTFKDGEPAARKKIEEFELDKWLLKEDHFRKSGGGFVFFVHTKFLLVDPLSNDPLVCTGSANFSADSVQANDENMLLIRGNTRVADIYLTEFDRIFRHFYFRKTANEAAEKGDDSSEGEFLCETSAWTADYFRDGGFKCRRREMFFTDPDTSWVAHAKNAPAPAKKTVAPKKPKAGTKGTGG